MIYEELCLKEEIYTLCLALTGWRGISRHSMEVRAREVVHKKTGALPSQQQCKKD